MQRLIQLVVCANVWFFLLLIAIDHPSVKAPKVRTFYSSKISETKCHIAKSLIKIESFHRLRYQKNRNLTISRRPEFSSCETRCLEMPGDLLRLWSPFLFQALFISHLHVHLVTQHDHEVFFAMISKEMIIFLGLLVWTLQVSLLHNAKVGNFTVNPQKHYTISQWVYLS